MTSTFRPSILTLTSAFSDQSTPAAPEGDAEFVVPADLTTLSNDELAALSSTAQTTFSEIYGDGQNLSDEQLVALRGLTEGIDALSAETATRSEGAQARADEAAALAARVLPGQELSASTSTDSDDDDADDADDATDETDGDADSDDDSTDEGAAETVVASARQEVRVPLNAVRRSTPRPSTDDAAPKTPGISSVLRAAAENLSFSAGEGVDWAQTGAALNQRLKSFNMSAYQRAADNNRHMQERHGLVTLNREIPEHLQITSNVPEDIDAVLQLATNEKNLPKGSLVASGGWCAPSETMYGLVQLGGSRDGMLSVPEVGISRGGVSFTKGPDFSTLYSAIAKGEWSITEKDDIDGKYAKGTGAEAGQNVVGDKPNYKVECTDFEEHRLDVDGIWITAGLLQSRGYPEMLAHTVRNGLVAHDHKLNGSMIAQMAAGSDLVTIPTGQAGAIAPLLTSIELQVEHFRYLRRMGRTATVEAALPFWIRGVVRTDLAKQIGVAEYDVPDTRIDGWFRTRGIAPQYVYNWQGIEGTAKGSFVAWPTTVDIMLYPAGTWFRGASDLITMDTTYDSLLLRQNDFTALFTEEAWFVAKRGHDSRLLRVPLDASGVKNIGHEIAHNGTYKA